MEQDNHLLDPIEITPLLQQKWQKIASWATFLSVFGFISLLLTLVFYAAAGLLWYQYSKVFSASTGPHNPAAAIGLATIILLVVITILSVVAFFIHRAHFLFATNITKSLHGQDQQQFETAWLNLRNHFRIYGVFIVVLLVLFFIALFWNTLYIKAPDYY